MKKTVDEIIFSLGCCMEEECEECKFFLLPFCKDRLMEAAKGALEDQKEQLGGMVVKKSKNRKIFTPPSLEDVKEYAAERGRLDLAQKFYDYYTASNWLDGTGRKVVSWKGKFVYWENNNPKPPESSFDVDEMFQAAVRRTYGEKTEELGLGTHD